MRIVTFPYHYHGAAIGQHKDMTLIMLGNNIKCDWAYNLEHLCYIWQ